MANSHFSEKKWKYVSIGLMAVLAVGFSFPQAFAHVTSDMKHGVEHVIALLNNIDTKVTAIKAKTDNLPTDPASQSAVEKSIPTQIINEIIRADLPVRDEVTCTSSSNFVVHVSSSRALEAEGGFLRVSIAGVIDDSIYPVADSNTLTFGADPDIPVTIEAEATSPAFLFAVVTMQTAEGATASCTVS
jgi:hypothetical protein